MKQIFWLVAFGLIGCGEEDPSKNKPDPMVDMSVPDAGRSDTSTAEPDVGPTGTPFRVGQFNTRRFFDTVCNSGNCSDASDFEAQLSDAEFNFKAQTIAAAIDQMQVDAITLEEIETQTVLDGLKAKLQTSYTVAELGETGASGSLDVAVLAKGELLEVRKHRSLRLERPDGSTTSFARELLEVHTLQGDQRVVIFAAHFKAQRNDDPGRRFAEAKAAGQIMAATAAEFPDALVVLGGDLNDTPTSSPLTALVSAGDIALLTEPGFWTYRFFQAEQHIDHLIYVRGGGGVVQPDSLEYFDDGSGGFGGSDHRAVRATFLLPE